MLKDTVMQIEGTPLFQFVFETFDVDSSYCDTFKHIDIFTTYNVSLLDLVNFNFFLFIHNAWIYLIVIL